MRFWDPNLNFKTPKLDFPTPNLGFWAFWRFTIFLFKDTFRVSLTLLHSRTFLESYDDIFMALNSVAITVFNFC